MLNSIFNFFFDIYQKTVCVHKSFIYIAKVYIFLLNNKKLQDVCDIFVHLLIYVKETYYASATAFQPDGNCATHVL